VEDIEACLKAWNQKMNLLLSSPSQRNLQEFLEGTRVLVSTFSLEQNDLIQFRLAAKDKLKRQAIGRKYTVGKGTVSVQDGRKNISEKLERQSNEGRGKGKGKATITITVSSDSDIDADSDIDDDQWDP
jgi:hypothetical protein